MTVEEKNKKKESIMNRIDRLDKCIHELEATANNFYSPEGKGLKGWNLLLDSRDRITKLRDKDWGEWSKLDS
ncbi:MAG: hypothetical protein JXQ96_14795 [Cyclobacteriaceae bacterium]